MKKKLLFLLGTILVIIFGSVIATSLVNKSKDKNEKYTVVSSFYPMYVLAKNIIGDIEEIDLINLTEYISGCLHDYQLTTADMKRLEQADAFIMNGAGMENFMEDILALYPTLPVIDSSIGIPLLESEHEHDHSTHEADSSEDGVIANETDHAAEVNLEAHDHEDDHDHDHDHAHEGEEAHDHDHAAEEEHNHVEDHDLSTSNEGTAKDTEATDAVSPNTTTSSNEATDLHTEESHSEEVHSEGDGHDHGEFNSHIWLNVDYHRIQLNNVLEELIKLQPAYEAEFRANAAIYDAKLVELKSKFDTQLASAKGSEVVIFHDAFAYLADQIGLDVVYTIHMDNETSLSAGDVAEVVDEINLHKIKVMFTEEQYSTNIPANIAAETDANVYIVDSVVTGDYEADGYIKAMEYNLDMLNQIYNK